MAYTTTVIIGDSVRRSDRSHTPKVLTNCRTVLLAGSRTYALATIYSRASTYRRNGSLGRGPKTSAGKARSSRNALKPGLSIP